MKKLDKKVIIGILVGLLVIIAVVAIILSNPKKGNKGNDNNNGGVQDGVTTPSYEEQTVDGLNFSGLSLYYENGLTNAIVLVRNTTGDEMYVERVMITFYDDANNAMGTTYFYIDGTLQPSEEKAYQAGIDRDVTNAQRVEYEVVR